MFDEAVLGRHFTSFMNSLPWKSISGMQLYIKKITLGSEFSSVLTKVSKLDSNFTSFMSSLPENQFEAWNCLSQR